MIYASGDNLIFQVGQKVVNMMIKSQRQGRDEKEAWQEVELEEHLACGCGCEPGAAEACVTQSMFNPATCECECTELIWGPERETCLQRSGDQDTWRPDNQNIKFITHFLLHKATIGMRELVRAETDTRLALYDYVRDIHINVPQIIFNIVSRLHQYSPNIPTIVNIRILLSICW